MQVVESTQSVVGSSFQRASKRLTPDDYANAGILKRYDRSPKEREAHDKLMEKYRTYLMKLCTMSSTLLDHASEESE